MKHLKYITLFIVGVLLISCNFKMSLSISDPEDIADIQKIINENFNDQPEIYRLQLSAPDISNSLEDIYRTYKVKNKFFSDRFTVSNKRFSDPWKEPRNFSGKKPFKVSDIDLTIIPEKYKEAIAILKEKKLAKDRDFYLSSWAFETNKKGEIYSDFTLNYFISSNSSGRKRTTTYGSFKFKVNTDKTLKLVK